ncbi:MAG TPA: tetratricopeptide repeat protein [Phycisphaerales bacterium]|nr:tetratricopeptide repeat protein [Phycisphaerales bacterium]
MTGRVTVGAPSTFSRVLLVAACLLALTGDPASAQEGPLRSYYTANGLLNRGLYEEAAAEYQAFLATEPTGSEAATARYGLALSLSQLGRPDEALTHLQSLDAPDDFPFAFESDLLHGQLLYSLTRFDDAARVFGRLLRRASDDPRSAEAAGLLIECLYRLGRHDEAVKTAQDLASASSGDGGDLGRAVLFAALSLSAQGRTDDASAMLQDLLERDDEIGRNAALSAADLFAARGELDEAAAQYQRLVALKDPRWSPAAHLGLARVNRAQGKSPAALANLRELLERYPDAEIKADASLELAINLVESNDHDAARRLLADLRAESGGALADYCDYWTAKSLLREGNAADAAALLATALEAHPDSSIRPEMLYDRAVALSASGEADAALELFGRLPEEHPDHRLAPAANLAGATTLLQLGRFDEAITRAEAIEPSAPEAAEASLVIAEADAMQGRHPRAIARLRRWLGDHPRSPAADRARYRLALSLAATGELPEAEATAGPLLERNPVDPRFRSGLLVLGDAAFAAQDWPRAEHWYSRAVEQQAEPRAAANLKLGLVLARQERHADAQRQFELAAEGDGDQEASLQAVFELGQSRLVSGDEQAAAAAFQTLLDRAPDSRFAGYALQHLGGIAERAGDASAAAALFARAAESEGDLGAAAQRDRARALLAAADYDAVRELASESDDPDLRAYAAIARARAGDHEGAIEQIDRVARSRSLSDDLRRAVLFERAWCQRRLGDDEAAAGSLRDLAEGPTPDRFTAYAALELAAIELDSGDAASAAPWLDRAASLMGSSPALVEPGMQAQLDFRLAQRDAAEGRHEQVIERLADFAQRHGDNPLAPSAALLLGDAYTAANRPRDAVRAFESALERAPETVQPAAMLRLGDALARAGDWQASREQFERYLASHGDSPHAYEAQFGLGQTLEHLGEYELAREAYAGVASTHQGPTAARAQFQIGECLFAQEKFEEAVRELLRVDILYNSPEWSAAALYEAGRAFEQLRKFGEARRQYRDTVERFPDTDWAPLARERLDRLAAADDR